MVTSFNQVRYSKAGEFDVKGEQYKLRLLNAFVTGNQQHNRIIASANTIVWISKCHTDGLKLCCMKCVTIMWLWKIAFMQPILKIYLHNLLQLMFYYMHHLAVITFRTFTKQCDTELWNILNSSSNNDKNTHTFFQRFIVHLSSLKTWKREWTIDQSWKFLVLDVWNY